MDYSVSIGEKALAYIAVPGISGRINRHVDRYRCAENLAPGNAAPVSAVVGVISAIAHYEVLMARNVRRRMAVGSWFWPRVGRHHGASG